jgi:NAD(P)-dependent dehydrogenase (short-subunit alcohol dehydrogenase family)
LVTGASTGIGYACAKDLAARDFKVFAGVRKAEDANRLTQDIPGVQPVILDVTRMDQLAEAADVVDKACGEDGLYGLVNNAGIVVAGPLEYVDIEDFRTQMEVNVTGQLAATQAFLPSIRTARGRVVNMGSTSGFFAPPFMGPYCASKYAIEAMTDCLRAELRGWGIQVSVVQPGAILTPIWDKTEAASDERLERWPEAATERYGAAIDKLRDHVKRVPKYAIPASRVADAVAHALTARRPKTRYLVGKDARVQRLLARWVPDRLRDRLVEGMLGV